MTHPEVVIVTLHASGEGVGRVTGTVSLDDTGFSGSVNVSNVNNSNNANYSSISGTSLNVSLGNVHGLTPRGYSISVNLSVVSDNYGTVKLSEEFHNAFRVLAEVAPVNRNLRSSTVYIYNGFTLVHILSSYVSLKWVRRYNRSGEFVLQLPNTPENVTLVKSGNIVCKDNDDEAGFIEDVSIRENIEVKGSFISKMLTFRVLNFVSEGLVDLQTTATQLIRQNYIDTVPERVIPGFRIGGFSISHQNVLARIENASVGQWLENLDAGFKVAFKPTEGAYEFTMYDGRRSHAEFCENFHNITDQQYFNQTAQSRNVVIVELPMERDSVGTLGAESVDAENPAQRITVGSVQGLERREAYIRAGRFPPVELGQQFLRQNGPVESLDVKIIDPYAPFEYRKDYDIGDIVTIVSERYGVTITRNILEITEYYDKAGFHIYAVFGSVPRNFLQELRDNSHRLEDLENNMPSRDMDFEWGFEVDLESIKDLIIPPLLDELFDMFDFGPLPDWLTEENLLKLMEDTANGVLDERLRPMVKEILEEMGLSACGTRCHVILDSLPTQEQIDSFPEDAVVVVYDPDVVYEPPS